MKRGGMWDRFMITLMGALIVFDLQMIWRSPAPLSETTYFVSIGIAALVIVLKVRAIRRAAAGGEEESRV